MELRHKYLAQVQRSVRLSNAIETAVTRLKMKEFSKEQVSEYLQNIIWEENKIALGIKK